VLRRLEPIQNQPIFAIILCNGVHYVTYVFECNVIQKHGDEFPTISVNMYFLAP